MTITVVNSTVALASNTNYSLFASNDGIVVGRDGLISITSFNFSNTTAIVGLESYHSVFVEGSVFGINAIRLGDDPTADVGEHVVVGPTGLLQSTSTAVVLYGSGSLIENFGTIYGGVYIGATGGQYSMIVNSGMLYGSYRAIGGNISTEPILVLNTGTIAKSPAANSNMTIELGQGNDVLTNRGVVIGDVYFGDGMDRYDGRGGSVDGTIYGVGGNDTFRPGTSAETINGGADRDTLDFRSTSGVRVALDGSFVNTGAAAGDDYTGMEIIYGSSVGVNVLRGDAVANSLFGGASNDSLSGGGGNDSLSGAFGRDVLTGDTGNDAFVFTAPSQGGDLITDFSAIAGNNDQFRIAAAGFGGGLLAGGLLATQFQTRSDNLAQDPNDRFIFRTGDATLWFDSNGSSAGGLTLLADLQAGAVVTYQDIVIF